jgi:hypothetical protein
MCSGACVRVTQQLGEPMTPVFPPREQSRGLRRQTQPAQAKHRSGSHHHDGSSHGFEHITAALTKQSTESADSINGGRTRAAIGMPNNQPSANAPKYEDDRAHGRTTFTQRRDPLVYPSDAVVKIKLVSLGRVLVFWARPVGVRPSAPSDEAKRDKRDTVRIGVEQCVSARAM